MPRSFEWLIMGGGLTRAPGTFFFILFAGYLIRVFRDLDQASAKFAVLSGGAVLLCHPERTLHALTMAMLFATLFVRTKRGVTNALIIAFGVAIVSIPWWGVNLARFGIDPFLLANRAGGDRSLFWSPLLLLNFTDETIAITALLGVIGILYEISKGRWILPLWAVLPFITDPRSAPHIAPIQFSLLAGIALVDVILPSLTTVKERSLEHRMGKIVIAYFLTIGLVNGLLGAFTLSALRLSVEERDALTWISQNIPSTGNRFLIYPRKSDAALSPLLEWFPALTSQTSLSTYQGREWLDGSLHSDAFFANREQWLACAAQKVQCIEDWSASSGEKVDYILFSSNTQKATHLSVSLLNSSEYILIYQDHGIKIFERNP
ncbi:MAG TPA: hypothetical protein VLA72_05425, partial [Anaerolineales bacterium]|nr:hypothetical protein [Anaerolineales bacterium]